MIRNLVRAIDRSPLLVLLALVVIAASARFVLALGNTTPWIFTDEFIYSELSRSLADRGDLLIRDDRIYYSTITPLLNAPGYLLGGTVVAYDWIKGANAVVMAAAALPAYGLARMALSARLSLAFAAILLALPAFAYVGVVMTEPAFLPIAILFVWTLARAIERPTLLRQAIVIGVVVLAILTRLQGLVLLVSIAVAIAYVLVRGDGERPWRQALMERLRGLWPLVVVTIGLPLLALAIQAARSAGGSRGLLGGYSELETGVSAESFIDWSTWHIAIVALAVGLVPFALAVATWGKFLFSPFRDRGVDAVLVAALAVTIPLLVQVVIFAINHSDRVQERNLFYVEPLVVLVALIGVAFYGFSRIVAIMAAGLTALAVIDLPVDTLLNPPPFSDTFTLLSLLKLGEWTGITVSTVAVLLALAGVALTAVIVFLPRRAAIAALCAGTLIALVVANFGVTPRLNDFAEATAASVAPEPRDWVDRAAGGEDVAFLWNSSDDPKLVWESEFWNESIRSVLAVPGDLPSIGVDRAQIDPTTGAFVPLRPVDVIPEERLVVAPSSWELVGEPIARADALAAGLVLWRIDGPPRLAGNASGLYQDGWTEPVIEVRRFDCEGGTFEVPLGLGHSGQQRLRISPSGGPERTITLRSPAIEPVRIPVTPEPGTELCTARIEVLDVATGAELGNPLDPRVLGARGAAPEFVPDA